MEGESEVPGNKHCWETGSDDHDKEQCGEGNFCVKSEDEVFICCHMDMH